MCIPDDSITSEIKKTIPNKQTNFLKLKLVLIQNQPNILRTGPTSYKFFVRKTTNQNYKRDEHDMAKWNFIESNHARKTNNHSNSKKMMDLLSNHFSWEICKISQIKTTKQNTESGSIKINIESGRSDR